MELIDTPNPNAKKIETNIDQDKVKKALDDISGVAYAGNPLAKLAQVLPEVDPDLVQRRLYGRHS